MKAPAWDAAEHTGRVEALEAILLSEKRHIFDYLYACLNVLDAKSNSLLQFNSIILVAFGTALHGSDLAPGSNGCPFSASC